MAQFWEYIPAAQYLPMWSPTDFLLIGEACSTGDFIIGYGGQIEQAKLHYPGCQVLNYKHKEKLN